ncbi:MAG: hypothetical protein K9H50_05845 [Aurantimicrobium sp.]|nr:hypothetical protein [Aurantimicrobium sp.]
MQTEIWKRRISFTSGTYELLDSLRPYLSGELSADWRHDATPEQNFAVALGWHLRALRVTHFEGDEQVEHEFGRRIHLVGPNATPNEAEAYFNKGVRGVTMQSPGSLMVDELTLDTPANIYFRVAAAYDLIHKMTVLPPGMRATVLANLPDQAIIDLVALGMASDSVIEPDNDELLFLAMDDIHDWVVEGLKAEGEDDFANDYFNPEEHRLSKKLELLQGRAPARPALVVPHILRELKIEPAEVLAYRERHDISLTDPFWTTARVQEALRLGLN